MKKLYSFLLNTLPRPLLIRMSLIFKRVAPVFYSGDNVSCPVCERSYRKFLSYGNSVTHRENVLCPYDLTLERHRLIWIYLKQKTNFFDKKHQLLHIAPEQCFHPIFKKLDNIEYVTGDLESPIADLHFDLHNIPLDNNQFDIVFCNHVMEHVVDPIQCMKELYRVLKPGGWGIMQVPQDFSLAETYEDANITSPEEREKHFWQKDHLRLFGRDYPDWLRKVGFEIEEFAVEKEFTEEAIERYRLKKSEILYIAHKK